MYLVRRRAAPRRWLAGREAQIRMTTHQEPAATGLPDAPDVPDAGDHQSGVPEAVMPGAGAAGPGVAGAGRVPAGRYSERGAATRSGLLAAAREVFISQGYAQAGVTDIVARAGASVGSLYHHYSGKAELYFALFDELRRDQGERTRAAVRRAGESGVTDPMELFLAGARAYLDACIDHRDLSRLFSRGDGPPGFEDAAQQNMTDWVGRNTEFFARRGEPLDEAVAIVMTGAMMVAVAKVSRAEDTAHAQAIADGVISVLSRLAALPAYELR
jgi:AcrR family transcriptional regulator